MPEVQQSASRVQTGTRLDWTRGTEGNPRKPQETVDSKQIHLQKLLVVIKLLAAKDALLGCHLSHPLTPPAIRKARAEEKSRVAVDSSWTDRDVTKQIEPLDSMTRYFRR